MDVGETCRLAQMAMTSETLLEGGGVRVGNATCYTNVAEMNPQFGAHLLGDIYVARTGAIAPVALYRLAEGTVLLGGEEFLVHCDGRLLDEQVAPYLRDDLERLVRLLRAWRPTIAVHEECMLAARYGIYTWGHWLAELLPRIVLTETRFPGRFRYVLPAAVVAEQSPRSAQYRIRESLQAYGIRADRILSLHSAMNYRFARLHAVGAVWSDHLMHPAAAELMRGRLLIPEQRDAVRAGTRIGLLRTGPGRAIANAEEVNSLLNSQGFSLHTVGVMPFGAQVQLFRSASLVFSVLGSDLTGLIYAQPGIRVISAAPPSFGDRLFYALILDRRGCYADLRGPVEELDRTVEHRSSFRLAPAEVLAALYALGSDE